MAFPFITIFPLACFIRKPDLGFLIEEAMRQIIINEEAMLYITLQFFVALKNIIFHSIETIHGYCKIYLA